MKHVKSVKKMFKLISFSFCGILIIFIATIFTLSCEGVGGGEKRGGYTAGDSETVKIDGVNVSMVFVPGGLTCPTGVNDEGTATVENSFWIANTEVTYELWQKVYLWSTSGTGGAIGEGQYTFGNLGIKGNDGALAKTVQHPVTEINWRDCIIWCNAFSEWYNAKKRTSYNCVYYSDSDYVSPLRTSSNSTSVTSATAGSQDYPYIYAESTGNTNMDFCSANGFRLLTSNEFELVARYRDGINWTYGDHVSGDNSGASYDDGNTLGEMSMSRVVNEFAFCSYNNGSVSTTAEVKTKKPNSLGVYDMNGNVWEYCFEWSNHPTTNGQERVKRGGCYSNSINQAACLTVGIPGYSIAYRGYMSEGFRFAKNVD